MGFSSREEITTKMNRLTFMKIHFIQAQPGFKNFEAMLPEKKLNSSRRQKKEE